MDSLKYFIQNMQTASSKPCNRYMRLLYVNRNKAQFRTQTPTEAARLLLMRYCNYASRAAMNSARPSSLTNSICLSAILELVTVVPAIQPLQIFCMTLFGLPSAMAPPMTSSSPSATVRSNLSTPGKRSTTCQRQPKIWSLSWSG